MTIRCSWANGDRNGYTEKNVFDIKSLTMNHNEQVEMKLLELLADRPKELSELAIQLRRLVAKMAPDSSELLYQTYAVSNVFTYTGKLGQAFIHIATYAKHVNLGFNQGVLLEDPDSLLHGSGKLIRHVRIDELAIAKQKNVQSLIKSAVQKGQELAEEAGGTKGQIFAIKKK